MESLQNTKTRLRAVKNIGQITKAMEVVSATKMRKAQTVALASRPYAFEALRILERVLRSAPVKTPLAEARDARTTLILIVSSDRGLAGSFNTQIFRAVDNFMASDLLNSQSQHNYVFVVIGKKAAAYAAKKNLKIEDKFFEAGDYVEPGEVWPIINFLVNGFTNRRWDRVVAVSTHFRTTLKQEVLARQILPADFEKIRETAKEIVPEYGRWAELSGEIDNSGKLPANGQEYIFEPSPEEALEALIPHLVEMQIYHLILEANASEHSARMVAMKNASSNAEDLSGRLTLDYNKARQASITKEIIEITSTQSAMA
ncbi:MAG: ATP synthase F1 subunit gamma [Candidatus Sungbacteria bacterium]|nr:ATP synthase F1 subunit gamma [Candidatus Sungbacteria bacterium]